MARQHGYFVLIPAFIPVDKKSLQNQIQTGTVIHEAAQTQDLSAILALPGIRYHAQKGRDGGVKEMAARWGSVEVEALPEGGEEAGPVDVEATHYSPDFVEARDQAVEEQRAEVEALSEVEPVQDEATTAGRRSRSKVA